MRIIAGKHRSRRIIGPADEKVTRPITDRVKTALFDRLASAGYLENAVVLDLFCGTGSMGLECLSRGAQRAVFVDRDREARKRLKQNLDDLREADKADIHGGNALGSMLDDITAAAPPTLIFCDPPYAMVREQWEKLRHRIELLAARCVPGALLVLRCEEDAEPGTISGWQEPRSHQYGSMKLHFYRCGSGSSPEAGPPAADESGAEG